MRNIPELELGPFLPLDTSHVQLRNSQGHLVIDVLIQDSHENDRQRSERNVDQDNVGVIEQIRTVEVVVDTVPEEGECPHQVL